VGVPTSEHVIFIPGVLLIGIVIGWMLGARAARNQIHERARKAKE
jgi:hypothetical protein